MGRQNSCGEYLTSSVGILKVITLIFGLVTIGLGVYSHFSSPYSQIVRYPDYTKYFSEWEAFHLNKPQPRSKIDESTIDIKKHHYRDINGMFLQIPIKHGNGFETCSAFKKFLQSLVENLKKVGVKVRLERENQKISHVLRCPRLLHERTFLGITIICCVTSFLTLMTVACCYNNTNQTWGRWIDAIVYLICGIAMLVGVAMSAYLIFRLTETCDNCKKLHDQFREGLYKYQDHWHPYYSRSKRVRTGYRLLLPKFLKFLYYLPYQSRQKIRQFSWTKKPDESITHMVALDCKIHLQYFWKLAATVFGGITGLFYLIVAADIMIEGNSIGKDE